MTITFLSYYKIPHFLAQNHNTVFKSLFRTEGEKIIRSNVEFYLNSTNFRIITIWPNKSLSFNMSSNRDIFYPDNFFDRLDDIND